MVIIKPGWIKIRNRYVQRSENKGIWCRKDAKDCDGKCGLK
jgi:hypothetical protein